MARTARRDVIGLLIEKQVTYTDVEADALIDQAKRLARESGRTVRAEAELLLSKDGESRLRNCGDRSRRWASSFGDLRRSRRPPGRVG